MADFGDEMGDSLKRVSNAFWRELFHRWLRDLEKGNYSQEQVGDQTCDVKVFDDEAQRKIFEQKLEEAGIQYSEKTIPAVSFNHDDAKEVEEIYRQIVNDIDTGKYTPTASEQEYFNDTPANNQVMYDLNRAVEEGKLSQDALNSLGDKFTMGDVTKMLNNENPDLLNELTQTWKARADKDAAEQSATQQKAQEPQEKDAPAQEKAEVPEDLKGPATQDQLNALNAQRDALSDKEIEELDAGDMTKQRAHEIMNEHPEAFNHFKTAAEKTRLDNEKASEQLEKDDSLGNEDEPEIEEEPQEESLDAANLEQPVEEVAEEIGAPEIGGEEKLSPELQSALDKKLISQEELDGLDPEAKLDNQTLADLHPGIADKMRSGGIDLPEGSWKEQIDKAVSKCFEPGNDWTEFSLKLNKYGIGVRTADTPWPGTNEPMHQYFVKGQENRCLNSCNTTSKLTFDDFKAPSKNLTQLSKEKGIDTKAIADLAKTATIPGRAAAALSALEQGLPGPIPPQGR